MNTSARSVKAVVMSVATGLILTGTFLTAGNASAATIPVFRVPADGYWHSVDDAHSCEVIGNDGTTEGIQCADMYAYNEGGGVALVVPGVEGYCQNIANPNNKPECASAIFSSATYGTNGFASDVFGNACGHAASENPRCASGRNVWANTEANAALAVSDEPSGGCDTQQGSPQEVWTVLQGNLSHIELPVSDKTVTATQNFASHHVIVCAS